MMTRRRFEEMSMIQPFHTTAPGGRHFYVDHLPDDEAAHYFFDPCMCWGPSHAWAWTSDTTDETPPAGLACFCGEMVAQ